MSYTAMIALLLADEVEFHLMNSQGPYIELKRTVDGVEFKVKRSSSSRSFPDLFEEVFNDFYRLLPKELGAPRLVSPSKSAAEEIPETPYRELGGDGIPF